MLISKKQKIIAMFLLIVLIASLTLMTNPIVKAQVSATQPTTTVPSGVTPDITITTQARISLRPNPVGLGQTFLVNIWTDPAPAFNRRQLGYSVTITKPDGSKAVLNMTSNPDDGTNWFEYIADQIGTWQLQFSFAGTYDPAGNYLQGVKVDNTSATTYGGVSTYGSVYFTPSSTAQTPLYVQENPVASWPAAQLPTDYWTRPVVANLREWASIMGDYPFIGPGESDIWPANTNPYESNYNFIPYVQAPSTAHVVWRRLGTIDGIVGAGNYQESYGGAPGGIQTLPVANNPTLIYDGRCYTTLSKVMDGIPQSVWECYDLRTGQIYWDQVNVTHPPTSISYETGAPIVAGGSAKQSMLTVSLLYIGSGMMTKYNPFTGAITYNISLSPLTSGTVFANNYVLSVQTIGSGASAKYYLVNWTDITEIQRGVNPTWAQRIQSNISWPINTVPSTSDYQVGVTATVSSITISGAYAGINVTGISLITGQVLWSTNTTEPIYSGSCAVADHGKIAVLTEVGHWLAWDLLTGRLAWTGQEMDLPWGASAFGGYACQSAYGLFYWEAYDGVYAYNWTNGQIAWHFLSPAPYPYETYYQDGNTTVYPFDQGAMVADGKIYTYNIEHSAISPLTRGWKIFCINATSGAGIWNMTNPSAVGGISDGYMSATSVYDGYQYIFGKGQSTTTVSAPQTQITTGQNAIISGTVLDKSPGDLGSYSNPTARTDFPTYVPCVSDESMQTYMDYLYMQLPIPSGVTVTGVPVSIDAVDPNGNFMHIATVTSDVSGTYSYTWTPTISGDYKITATFVGTDAYGSSFAEAHANVVNAPTTSPTPTPTISGLATTSDLMTYIVVGVIAIIIAIAIATVLILRKHP